MATTADESIKLLSDPSRWVIRRNVPIFKANVRESIKDGKTVKKEVTAADLQKCVSAMANAEREAGMVACITPGHLDDDKPERDQPPVYGFAKNPRLGTFGPNKIQCVMVDEWIKPEYADESKDYPYRSSDYWYGDHRISAVAMLKQRPALDVGVVAFQNRGERLRCSFSESAMEPGGSNTGIPQLTPEEQALADKFAQYYCSSPNHMKSFAAGLTPKEEENPETPPAEGGEDEEAKKKKAEEEEKLKTQAEGDKAQFSELKARLEATEKVLRDVTAERDREACERFASDLEADGFVIDRKHEVDTLIGLNKDGREKYLKNARARYQKRPDGRIPVDRTEPTPLTGGEKSLTKDQMQECVRYAAEKEISFEKARKLMLDGKMV